jgi:hypothetical protein
VRGTTNEFGVSWAVKLNNLKGPGGKPTLKPMNPPRIAFSCSTCILIIISPKRKQAGAFLKAACAYLTTTDIFNSIELTSAIRDHCLIQGGARVIPKDRTKCGKVDSEQGKTRGEPPAANFF